MRQRMCLEFLKDYDFELSYHPSKANVVENTLSINYLHMSTLMVREMDLIGYCRDLTLVCEVTRQSIMLCMLKLTNNVLDEIREGQKKILD